MSYLLSVARFFQMKIMKNGTGFYDLEKQKEILDSFDEPVSLIERSYYQYKCQVKMLPKWLVGVLSISSIFFIPIFFIRHLSFNNAVSKISKVAVFIAGEEEYSYIPNKLKEEFSEIKFSNYNQKKLLDVKERNILRKMFREYWKSPYFIAKCMIKIAIYANQIYTYQPSAILTIAEFSFTSSLLTYYCNEFGVEHINIMHGEKLFDITDSFVEFNRYFLWDTHYKELLIKLRAGQNQFHIDQPEFLKLNLPKVDNYKYDLTYYLGGEDLKTLETLNSILHNVYISPDKISIRCHPRYSNVSEVTKIFNDFNIDLASGITIRESLASTKYVASLFSTVLYLGLLNGKQIVVDNQSNPGKYLQLRNLDFIILNKKHRLLSEFLK